MGRLLLRHGRALAAACLLLLVPGGPTAADDPAIVVKTAAGSFAATVERLTSAIESRGAKVAAVVDHDAAARANGLALGPTTLVIFGNPNLGTPLMQSQRTAGLDLPLRVLVWEDADGVVRVAYWPPSRIAAAHGIADRGDVVVKMAGALHAITEEAIRP
ncbi:MAG: DUF302 domain-containing protein [Dongiaceae bacterium]